MHMLIATIVGILTLGVCLGIGRIVGGRANVAAAWAFLGIWLVASAVHFYNGLRAGYSVGEELAVHTVIFGVPAALAAYVIATGKGGR